MDENSVSRMCARSFKAVRCRSAFIFGVVVMLCSSFLWSISTTLLWGMTSKLSWVAICCSLSIASIPIVAGIAPMAHWFLAYRAGKPASLFVALKAHWRLVVLAALAAFVVALFESIVALLLAVWMHLLLVPGLGAMLYLVGSWVERLVVTLMVGLFLSFFLASVPILVTAVRIRWKSPKDIIEILKMVSQDWVVRCKLHCIGVAPLLVFLFLATIGGRTFSRPFALELAASCVRAVIFAVASAPLLVFYICMAVEADRYIRWRQS